MNRIDNANNAPRCEHIKLDGKRCGAPALHGRRGCRFHFAMGDFRAPFPMIEDGLSLQVALNQIARAILDRSLDRKTATTLLYCFQIMSTNLKQMNAERKLSQKKDEDDDLPGPSLAQILLDKLKEIEIDDEEEEKQPASTPVSPSSIDNRQSAMPFGSSGSTAVTPVTQNPTFVIPSAAEGPFVPASLSPQSSIDNRQSAMPFGPPRPPASPAVNKGVVDKLHACAQSPIDNRQSSMPFGPSSLAPPITMSAS